MFRRVSILDAISVYWFISWLFIQIYCCYFTSKLKWCFSTMLWLFHGKALFRSMLWLFYVKIAILKSPYSIPLIFERRRGYAITATVNNHWFFRGALQMPVVYIGRCLEFSCDLPYRSTDLVGSRWIGTVYSSLYETTIIINMHAY